MKLPGTNTTLPLGKRLVLQITPLQMGNDESYLNTAKQALLQFADGTSQTIEFDCSQNTQSFVLAKKSTEISIMVTSFCKVYDANYANYGFEEISVSTGVLFHHILHSNSSFIT